MSLPNHSRRRNAGPIRLHRCLSVGPRLALRFIWIGLQRVKAWMGIDQEAAWWFANQDLEN